MGVECRFPDSCPVIILLVFSHSDTMEDRGRFKLHPDELDEESVSGKWHYLILWLSDHKDPGPALAAEDT